MSVRRKQSSASSGLWTIGSFSLNEVLRSTGTPVAFSKAFSSCQYSGSVERFTV